MLTAVHISFSVTERRLDAQSRHFGRRDGHGGRNNQSASEILHIKRGLNDGGTGVHTVGTRQPVVQSQLAWRRATVLEVLPSSTSQE